MVCRRSEPVLDAGAVWRIGGETGRTIAKGLEAAPVTPLTAKPVGRMIPERWPIHSGRPQQFGASVTSRIEGAGRIVDHALLPAQEDRLVVSFTFDGAPIAGRLGEPVAAALIASGIRVFRTMPRFGEPRGGYCMIGRCADCQVIVDGVPGVMACVTPVREGIAVQTQHGLGEDVESREVGGPQ
jgi:2Fe-2S iron-sulfur cluster binding domain